MKLMKLLTVGRSFKGAQPVSGQYKLQQSLLPKFSSSVRPSKAAAARMAERLPKLHASVVANPIPLSQQKIPSEQATPESTPVVEPIAVVAPVVANVTAESNPPAPDKTQKIPAGKTLQRVPETVVPEKTKFSAALKKKLGEMKKRFFPPRSRKKSGTFATQTEMALEKITVARNDLSDADLEVVMAKAAAKTGSRKPHFADLGRVTHSSVAWVKKTTTNLFKPTSPFQASGAEKTRGIAPARAEKECELVERT